LNWPDDFINKIICGDCLEIMKNMPDKCVDITLTSPPFNNDDENDKENYWEWYSKFMVAISKITKDYALIFNSSTRLIEIIKRYQTPFRILIWNKIRSQMSYRYEPIFVYKFKADYSLNSFIYTDIFSVLPIFGNKQIVPYENPIKLYSKILSIFKEEKIVFDPCIGSGTTARVAKDLKHNFIGIEINPNYCKIAEERLAQGVL